MQEIGKKIKTLRQKNGWSQGDVAKKLNISVPAFSKIEAGITDINVSRLEQIAIIFEVPLTEMFSSSPVESPEYVDELKRTNELNEANSIKIIQLQEYVIRLYEELSKVNKQTISGS